MEYTSVIINFVCEILVAISIGAFVGSIISVYAWAFKTLVAYVLSYDYRGIFLVSMVIALMSLFLSLLIYCTHISFEKFLQEEEDKANRVSGVTSFGQTILPASEIPEGAARIDNLCVGAAGSFCPNCSVSFSYYSLKDGRLVLRSFINKDLGMNIRFPIEISD